MSLVRNPITRTMRSVALKLLRAPTGGPGDVLPEIRVEVHLFWKYIARTFAPDGGTYVELGPAAGGSAIEFLQRSGFDERRSYMIEACPTNCEVLRKVLPNAVVSNYAVAGKRGVVDFYVVDDPREPGSSRSNSMDASSLLAKGMSNLRKIEVPAIPIGEYCIEKGLASVDYLHMNIEGAEYDVFEGNISFLDSVRFLYLDLHYGLYLGETSFERMTERKLQIYDAVVRRGFERIGGYTREDIPLHKRHQTFLFERAP